MQGKFSYGEDGHKSGGGDGCGDTHEKGRVVASAHTVVEPLAVVVEVLDALVARAAVLGPGAGGADGTQVAAALLDDVRVLSAV